MPETPFADRLAQFALHRYWHALPDLQDATQLNPFSYAQRIGAYKLLIDGMNSKNAFGADNELNMFWGFITQLDWQWRSGRLFSPVTNPQPIASTISDDALIAKALNDAIALDSWWGCCNYSLSIIPLIAAMQVGILPQIEILLTAAPENAAVSVELKFAQGGGDAGGYSVPAPFKKPVEEWRAFFKLVKKAKAGEDLEPLRMAAWHAHLLSITAATKLYLPEQRLLPRQEQAFGRGWIRMVDFLGASAWRTDLAFLTDEGQGNLPPRILHERDVPGKIADMDAATNVTLQSVFALGKMNRVRFSFNRWIWTRAMRTREARNNAPRLLRASFDPSPDYAADRKQLQKYIRARGKKEV